MRIRLWPWIRGSGTCGSSRGLGAATVVEGRDAPDPVRAFLSLTPFSRMPPNWPGQAELEAGPWSTNRTNETPPERLARYS